MVIQYIYLYISVLLLCGASFIDKVTKLVSYFIIINIMLIMNSVMSLSLKSQYFLLISHVTTY